MESKVNLAANQSESKRLHQPEFRQEFRLGLVVYGGVSLAIYMNGVCREFYNAVRGRGVYKLVKALTDSDIIVDVISGTSAGGINGVLLSYALTNSDQNTAVDFKNFAQIWRESGDISKLLRQPDLKPKPPDPTHEVNSVLDGEGYYQKSLREAFEQASSQRDKSPQKNASEWFSDSSELDLFVTGTDTLGRVSKAFDNTGSVIEVKDHRTVFLLKYRRHRKHPFQPLAITQQSLAKLCRITSCFPVAFPVVSVKIPAPDQAQDLSQIDEIDRRLVRWGDLAKRELPPIAPRDGYKLHFVDGGVLDNRPFSYTIREIYYRVAYRPVERRLFYIDPSPDQFLGSPKFNKMAKPSIWATVSDSLVGMPRYESISGDLQDIKDRNERVLRYKFLRATAERVGETKLKASQQGQPPSDDAVQRRQIYLRCRLVGMRDRILPLILRIDQASRNRDSQALLETAAQILTRYITDRKKQEEREKFLHQIGQEIRNLDVDYALRKHFFLLEKICQCMTESQSNQTDPRCFAMLRQLAQRVGWQVALLEIIQAALVGMLQSKPVSQTFYNLVEQAQHNRETARQQIYSYLLALHRFLLDAEKLPDFKPAVSSNRAFDLDAPEQQEELVEVAASFFNQLPDSLSGAAASVGEADQKQVSAKISSVYAQLKQRAEQLTKPGAAQSTADQITPEHLTQQSRYSLEAHFKAQPDFENNDGLYCSILFKIEQATEKLILEGLADLPGNSPEDPSEDPSETLSDELLKRFKSFRYIDEEVYSYEYLSDIQAKEQIEIIRISPDVAQFGFGKGKGLAEKLAGDQLNAFGGFFKKSWRSNDILWGRLDGLNRIVEALLTPEALKKFPGFIARQVAETGMSADEYLKQLLNEALPAALPAEKTLLLDDLKTLAQPDQSFSVDDLSRFLDTLVTAAHRAVLQTDLGNVLEDAMAEQIDWSQQLVPSGNFQKLASSLGYRAAQNPTVAGISQQQQAVQRIDQLVANLLSSNRRQAQKLLQQEPPAALLESAFGQFKAADPAGWNRLRQSLDDLSRSLTSSAPSIDQIYDFLKRLIAAGQAEKNQLTPEQPARQQIAELNQRLKAALKDLLPKYQPVSGYFDRSITPFAVQELAAEPVKNLLQDSQQVDDYFRNLYRVGSEKLAEDVPTLVLEDIAARAGLVLRDIVNASPAGNTVRRTTLFQLVNRLLQSFYLWVRSRNPKTSGILSALKSIPILLWQIAAVAGIAFLVSRLPGLLLVLIVTLVILQLLNSLTAQVKLPSWAIGLLLTATAAFLLIVGPHLLPVGGIDWAVPFSKLRISIQRGL